MSDFIIIVALQYNISDRVVGEQCGVSGSQHAYFSNDGMPC